MIVRETKAIEPNVLIIGAGFTGLLLAQALKKAGIKNTVFESDATLQRPNATDWGIAIHWALPLMRECLPPEIFARIQSATVDPTITPPDNEGFPMFNGETGELMKEVPLPKLYRFSRLKARALLSENLDIQFSKALTTISAPCDSTSVIAHFSDGTFGIGTTLIGADGSRSTVRRFLYPDKESPCQSAYTCFRAILRFPLDSQAQHMRRRNNLVSFCIHPNGVWSWISVMDGDSSRTPSTWSFQLLTTLATKVAPSYASPRALRAIMASFAEPWRSAWAWMPDDTHISTSTMSYWMPEEWDSREGRVNLIGDAGHAMPFHRGQGLQHSVVDVVNLAHVLSRVKCGEVGLGEAMEGYQKEMIERAGKEVQLSLENTRMVHCWEEVLTSPVFQQGVAMDE